MTASEGRFGPFFARWCGWVLVFAAVMTPLLGWLGPLGFAPLMAIVGLLTLPAFEVREADRPAAIALLVTVLWAASSMIWSPFQPDVIWSGTAAKLAAQGLLYWAAWCAVRRADPAILRQAMWVFLAGMSLLSAVVIFEAATGARLYQAVRAAIGDPIRPDLAVKNVAQGVFVLAVLWAPAALAAIRLGWWQLAVLLAAAVAAGSIGLAADAPIIALAAGVTAAAAVWRWPLGAPRVMAAGAAVFFLAAPLIVWGLQQSGLYARLQAAVSLSWSMRMDYWSYALGWIGDKPFRGWGLDASRMFGPGIRLHPHNGALQIWLELGLIGAAAAAVFWASLFHRLERRAPDPGAMAGAAAAVAYLTFAAVSFGVWQEWWLALGALAVVASLGAQRLAAGAGAPAASSVRAKASTYPHLSE
ncbi:MAG: O-antigen ligase family protein [Phenylobacterium sp.]|uniref:O-antigen ligase family protein n=1 Tax=Phenylobacterium sp. TaxID=1871053 RepID=UPI00391A2459